MWLSRTRARPDVPRATGLLPATLALVLLLTHTPQVSGQRLPPIAYEGRALTTARLVKPEQGDETMQLGSTASLNLRSYVWQPWFATIGSNLSLSQVSTRSSQTSSSVVATGDARLQVFPRSRFPFTAYGGISDSRTRFESEFAEERGIRRSHFGIIQQYRPSAGNASYVARAERAIEDGTADRLNEVTDRLNLDAAYAFGDHSLDGNFSLQNSEQNDPGSSFRDMIATLRHGYRPSTRLSVESHASLTDIVSATQDTELHTTSGSLSSFAIWRPDDEPLTVTGNARFNTNRTSGTGLGTSSYSSNVSLGANYDLTRALRISGNMTGRLASGSDSASSSQSLTLGYNPENQRLWGFDYNWFASTSANNSFSGAGTQSRGVSAIIGHGLNRVFMIDQQQTTSVSTNLNESLSSRYDTRAGSLFSLNHGLSAALARSLQDSTTRLRLIAQDNRAFTTSDDTSSFSDFVQSAGLQASHDHRLGRHATLNTNLSLNYTRQSVAGRVNSFPSSSLDLNYRNSRIFGVNRLRFHSQLSMDASSLFLVGIDEEDHQDISWTNRLDYSIGRIDARLSAAIHGNDGEMSTVIFFTLSRRMGGVF
ncbi:MAG: hypothetical protein KDK91_23110 [Gammaproteobacteria bacterium]|nr:hypothetical protein [Gammaproteobacteria bacterium]